MSMHYQLHIQRHVHISVYINVRWSRDFDTIDHQILLRKLQRYGVRGIACDWFKSYLENRVQYVSYNTKDSDYMKIMCGVPQGSILGPLLFILYINYIVKVSTVLNPVLFADDTSLFHAHTDFDILIEEINEELQKITTWFHTNKLSLNIKKSNFIIFLPKGKKCNTENVKININGNEIKRVNFTKFLGIYIDEHLSWAQHIEFLSKQIARNVGILSKLKHFLPMYIMNTLYYSLILSHLQYCTLLWANTYSTCLNKLRILQKKLYE